MVKVKRMKNTCCVIVLTLVLTLLLGSQSMRASANTETTDMPGLSITTYDCQTGKTTNNYRKRSCCGYSFGRWSRHHTGGYAG